MAWLRTDDTQTEHPKVLALIDLAGYEGYYRWDQLKGWASRHHTGGAFSRTVASQLGVKPKQLAALVEVGLVEDDGQGSLSLHDFNEYNGPQTDAERARQYRARRALGNGDAP